MLICYSTMTSKIQNIAMFAIAAFALSGMMVAPAFAATIASANTNLTVSGSVSTDSASSYGCTATQGQSLFTNDTTVVDGSNDRVFVEYNGSACPDTESVKVKIKVDGTWVHDQTYNNDYGTVTVYTDISSGDNVRAYVTFYD